MTAHTEIQAGICAFCMFEQLATENSTKGDEFKVVLTITTGII